MRGCTSQERTAGGRSRCLYAATPGTRDGLVATFETYLHRSGGSPCCGNLRGWWLVVLLSQINFRNSSSSRGWGGLPREGVKGGQAGALTH